MFTVLSLTLLLAADSPEASAARKVRYIIGHRGSAADRPENTLAGVRRAIETGADAAEVDIRTTRDGALICLHDADVARTTDGQGKVSDLTLAEVKKLDAGIRFAAEFKGERVPTFAEVLTIARGKITVMVDLKEDGTEYIEKVAAEIREFGEPERVILGVRSLGHARAFARLLPKATQIGLIPTAGDIEAFAAAGVKTIRLWPRWLTDETLVPRVRKLGLGLHLGAGNGTRAEVLPLLVHQPESLSSDDPAELLRTLTTLGRPKP